MKVYKTYQDCKIANPSSEVIQRNGDAMFLPVGNSELIPMLSGCINCKPSEYLISIKDFFDRGHAFLVGDCFLNQHGEVIEVGKRYEDGIVIMPDEANRRTPGTDENCYILRAAAMEIPTQTQEERESLDMIDTTSKQVESLGNNSESPNSSKYNRAVGGPVKLSPPEWIGEGLPPIGVECEILFKEYPHKGFGLFNVLAYHGGAIWVQYTGPLENNGKCYTAECSTLEFRKLESPEQKSERERDEAIKAIQRDMAFSGSDYHAAKRLYEKGYRKESK